MRTLSGREKSLIYIAMLLTLISLGNWILLQPVQRILDESTIRLEQLTGEKSVSEENSSRLAREEAVYEEERKKLIESFEKYEPVSSQADLEAYVLDYLETENLEVISTSIEGIGTMVKVEREGENERSVRTGVIVVRVRGQKQAFLSLLDQLALDPILRVSGCSIYQENEPEGIWNMNLDITYSAPGSMEELKDAYEPGIQE